MKKQKEHLFCPHLIKLDKNEKNIDKYIFKNM